MDVSRQLALALACALAQPAAAQSLLERPPNLSGAWTGAPGTLHFNFVHRFAASDGDERKVTAVPTFLVAGSLPARTMLGLSYSTNSALAAGHPNEWELFGRWLGLSQDQGAPLDAGVQVGWNDASEGMDAELSLARRVGRLRVMAAGRSLSELAGDGERRIAIAGGASLRLATFLALAADVAALNDARAGEETAWSAGVQLAIPQTPHTLSLQASNAPTTSLQGASRAGDDVRYGFEFTIPLTLRRYLGAPPRVRPAPPVAAMASPSAPASGDTVRTTIRNLAYAQPALEITAGTTVTWTNADPLAHTVTAADGSFDSALIQPSRSWSHTFTQPGTYDYSCTPHPFMKATVVVRAAGGEK